MSKKTEDLSDIQLLDCGIIMPISTIDGNSSEHWSDVKLILEDAISKAGFLPRLVSDSDQVRFIHNTIITNLFNDEIIVCDVSAKNPNVMFELGIRLAFNKPVVIVIDDQTDINFDTGIISHLFYRRDLRHSNIEKFKIELTNLILKTHKASKKDDYTPFLNHFGNIKAGELGKEFSQVEFIMKQLDAISKKVDRQSIDSQNNLAFNNSSHNLKNYQKYKNEINKNEVIHEVISRRLTDWEPGQLSFALNVIRAVLDRSPAFDLEDDLTTQISTMSKSNKINLPPDKITQLVGIINRHFPNNVIVGF
jgi:hypothetical protein